MAVAKDLLRRYDVALAQVAERVGYGSASTFSIAFSRHVGRPPGPYAREGLNVDRPAYCPTAGSRSLTAASGVFQEFATDSARIVNNRSMPDGNLHNLIAVALIDGTVSFDASHSYECMKDPQVLAARRLVDLVADRGLMDPAAPRSVKVDVRLRDARTVSHFTRHAPGTKENPLDTAGVEAEGAKSDRAVLGARRAAAIIERVKNLNRLANVRELAALLRT